MCRKLTLTSDWKTQFTVRVSQMLPPVSFRNVISSGVLGWRPLYWKLQGAIISIRLKSIMYKGEVVLSVSVCRRSYYFLRETYHGSFH